MWRAEQAHASEGREHGRVTWGDAEWMGALGSHWGLASAPGLGVRRWGWAGGPAVDETSGDRSTPRERRRSAI